MTLQQQRQQQQQQQQVAAVPPLARTMNSVEVAVALGWKAVKTVQVRAADAADAPVRVCVHLACGMLCCIVSCYELFLCALCAVCWC
jgi:hypothetical protein